MRLATIRTATGTAAVRVDTLLADPEWRELPAESDAVDWEAELAVVIGQRAPHADGNGARAAIAGYGVLNDVSMVRNRQFRTNEWLQGKTFEILTLSPEDVIVTGSMGGVSHARKPPRYPHPGQKLVTRIAGVGLLINQVLDQQAAR
jgi:acylpyruvate hydrolase